MPVYEQKQRILETLENNQVIVVQSPTGSGKTTQIPVILHEAGYSNTGVIAVTQPRRIAALSVSEFISKQLGTSYPGLVGYKMRFEDKTDSSTKIKIMTDGILLQEMKLDPWMSKYSVIMVDEAHERSLNIDFVLGLLKRILAERPDFKVIISSATMNAEAFSMYFDGCPIVTIDTITYPVTLLYDPPAICGSTASTAAEEALLDKIENTIDRVLSQRKSGDILCFLPGEKTIKNCMKRLYHSSFSRRIHIVPLYGRLAKEEQEKVFDSAPFGRKKVILSTNIAETSVTIPGITTVIDSGLAKINSYSPRTFTSSLNEVAVSKASCNQRKGRAGRTQPGMCYRLYPRKEFESRPLYTLEEIYRTDLSEVVLRMAELGIYDFYKFDFISPPSKEGIRGAIETLNLLDALNPDNSLSKIGELMVRFPLLPRVSRMIVESIVKYPDVMEQVLIAAAFLSVHSPFILPPGEETDARQAHHKFRSDDGDFVSYVNLYNQFVSCENTTKFCEKSYLDERVMAEIVNIKTQLEEIVVKMGFPILKNGKTEDYLSCVASGMIQFVCIMEQKDSYKSLTADRISIHPGSNMFRMNPQYIVAGEIVRTSRMFAMSVSPLSKTTFFSLKQEIEKKLSYTRNKKDLFVIKEDVAKKSENLVTLGNHDFIIRKIKGKKHVILPYEKLVVALSENTNEGKLKQLEGLKSKVLIGSYEVLAGEKLENTLKLVKQLDFKVLSESEWNRKLNIHFPEDKEKLLEALGWILRIAVAKQKSKELGFICLFTDGNGCYWLKVSRGFATALNESLSSLEVLSDESKDIFSEDEKAIFNNVYRKLHDLYEDD